MVAEFVHSDVVMRFLLLLFGYVVFDLILGSSRFLYFSYVLGFKVGID